MTKCFCFASDIIFRCVTKEVFEPMSEFQILHQAEEDLFYVALEDGQRAYIKYRRSDSKSAIAQVDFWTTFVPETYRGKGLAALLVQHAFAWADSENLFITTSCWYAAKKLEQRKLEEKELEEKEFEEQEPQRDDAV